jgi:hypothetical protein
MTPSDEQQTIIDHLKQNKNVVVDAVAGSGKSTTILFLAEQMKDKQILQITYNSALRLEVKHKLKECNCENVKVHTFHSLAVRHYMPTAHTDTELRNIMRNETEPLTALPFYDIVVLDEVQDMTKLYCVFVQKFIRDMLNTNEGEIQLLILGDYMQGLYEFKGSDVRYLTFAEKIWRKFPRLKTQEFVSCSLKMSYRLTNPMASFVNEVMLGENRLLACREGTQVVYIRDSKYTLYGVILKIITDLLNAGNRPDDFFFLGPSMKSTIRKLENALVEREIPCFVPGFDKEKIDDRVINGKIVFSSFHSVKGRQRKFVFVTGFDDSYFEIFGKDLEKNKCPNTLYVGCTRATEKMFIIETDGHPDNRPLHFLKMNHPQMKRQPYIEFKGSMQMVQCQGNGRPLTTQEEAAKKNNIKLHYITPTNLIKFLDDSVLEEFVAEMDSMFEKISTEEDETDLDIPVVIETERGFCEDVSDLNGIAIPCMFTDAIMKENSLYKIVESSMKELKSGDHKYLREIFNYAPKEMKSVEDYLYLANIFTALQEKLYFKLNQIERNEYSWLSKEMVAQCLYRFQKVVLCEQTKPEVEVTIINPMMTEENKRINALLQPFFPKDNFLFTARMDMICDDMWEFKCVSNITVEHFMQVMIYAWIWKAI